MHDAGAGLQRAEEIDGVIGRVAEEQRDGIVLAAAGAQERSRESSPNYSLGLWVPAFAGTTN
jgi:hypothetical protein